MPIMGDCNWHIQHGGYNMFKGSHSAGKGDRPRKMSKDGKANFDKTMDNLFGEKIIKTWNPDEDETVEETKSGKTRKTRKPS
jgi:hypothetical protein